MKNKLHVGAVKSLSTSRASIPGAGCQYNYKVSRVMGNPAFCICENKAADQLHSNCAADQRICFRYTDNTIPLIAKSEISSLQRYSVIAQPGLCQTWAETPKTGFYTTRGPSDDWHLLDREKMAIEVIS